MALALMSCDDSGTSSNGAEVDDSSSSVTTPSSSSTALAWCATTGNCGTFTDTRDSKVYRWTKIGTQTWMAENLAYLPGVNAKSDNSSIVAKYYVYSYDGTSVSDIKASRNYTTYGVLYNWAAAGSACPSGWHLPSSAEWTTLESYEGGSSTAGTSLKATSGWERYSGISNLDTYGFSALPGGYYYGLDFTHAFQFGYWWTATEIDATDAYYRRMYCGDADVHSYSNSKGLGFSVRCVQN
jgi:uncharacterized protein (TIGR02145 family)